MSFISYAQNLEDVMLYRALKHIDRGFYIDVGALYPDICSVTKAFYDIGWHGVNIEPIPQCFNLIQSQRPEDINLNIAISNKQGRLLLNEIIDKPGDTTASKFQAEKHVLQGHKVRTFEVPCTTLDKICEEKAVNAVHFLKIDVEGSEKEVLEGFSFRQVRPWIIVIEANEPNSIQDTSGDWESLILGKKYECVYYDGLNRFYLAMERQDLKVHFRVPPNVFDRYLLYSEYSERNQKEVLARQLQQIYTSYTWRFTAPLRRAELFIQNLVVRIRTKGRQAGKKILGVGLRYVKRHKPLLQFGRWLLKNHPKVRARLRILVNLPASSVPHKFASLRNASRTAEQMTESARMIYESLKDIYRNRK